MTGNQWNQKPEDDLKSGRLDDILAQIDAAYADHRQLPVFTCQEEELAFWSRRASLADDAGIPSDPFTQQPES